AGRWDPHSGDGLYLRRGHGSVPLSRRSREAGKQGLARRRDRSWIFAFAAAFVPFNCAPVAVAVVTG
ncbi:MAG TPA: hypothetical protein VKA51_15405, partial [Rubrobacteraceae bacterium]|nr:hypothetical protein [Rubrobacteraceae bacterium]